VEEIEREMGGRKKFENEEEKMGEEKKREKN
jgi:hypothetical protein